MKMWRWWSKNIWLLEQTKNILKIYKYVFQSVLVAIAYNTEFIFSYHLENEVEIRITFP